MGVPALAEHCARDRPGELACAAAVLGGPFHGIPRRSGGVRTTAGETPPARPPFRGARGAGVPESRRLAPRAQPRRAYAREFGAVRVACRTVGAARPALAPGLLDPPVRRFVAAHGPASRRPTAGRGSGLALARRAVGRVRRHYR